MSKVLTGTNPDGTNYYVIECPACGCGHSFDNRWKFNGDIDKPTFTPSLLVKSGHYMTGHKGDCWCTYAEKHPDEILSDDMKCRICHSFVTDGKIQYLSDCTHKYAGQTLELDNV
jgi:hypothetical protein